MERLILTFGLFFSMISIFALDLTEFIEKCKEMPDAGYRALSCADFQKMISEISENSGSAITPDSLYDGINGAQIIMFIPKDPKSIFDGNDPALFENLKTDILDINGYEEYTYSSMSPSADAIPDGELESMMAGLPDEQKSEVLKLLQNGSKIAIFGERNSELEFKNPIFLLDMFGMNAIYILDGIIPLNKLQYWHNTLSF